MDPNKRFIPRVCKVCKYITVCGLNLEYIPIVCKEISLFIPVTQAHHLPLLPCVSVCSHAVVFGHLL